MATEDEIGLTIVNSQQEFIIPTKKKTQKLIKYPCGKCGIAVTLSKTKWSIKCTDCLQWFHQDCLGMSSSVIKSWSGYQWYCGCRDSRGIVSTDFFDSSTYLTRTGPPSNASPPRKDPKKIQRKENTLRGGYSGSYSSAFIKETPPNEDSLQTGLNPPLGMFSDERNIFKPLNEGVHTREEKRYKCEICNRGYNRLDSLKSHVRIHDQDYEERPYLCDICGKRYMNKYSFNWHLRVHHGDKPYECELCGKTFSRRDNLKTHARVHSGEKPYECEKCGKRFNQLNNLTTHSYLHSGEKEFTCPVCGQQYNLNNSLKYHMRTHTGLKPYPCPMCDKSFAQSGTLKDHIRIHTKEKPYICKICGMKYNQSGTLKSHMRIHDEANESNGATDVETPENSTFSKQSHTSGVPSWIPTKMVTSAAEPTLLNGTLANALFSCTQLDGEFQRQPNSQGTLQTAGQKSLALHFPANHTQTFNADKSVAPPHKYVFNPIKFTGNTVLPVQLSPVRIKAEPEDPPVVEEDIVQSSASVKEEPTCKEEFVSS